MEKKFYKDFSFIKLKNFEVLYHLFLNLILGAILVGENQDQWQDWSIERSSDRRDKQAKDRLDFGDPVL